MAQATLGDFIREQRVALGLRPFELAAKAGLSPTHIYKLENGQARNPEIATLSRLAAALGADRRAIVERAIEQG